MNKHWEVPAFKGLWAAALLVDAYWLVDDIFSDDGIPTDTLPGDAFALVVTLFIVIRIARRPRSRLRYLLVILLAGGAALLWPYSIPMDAVSFILSAMMVTASVLMFLPGFTSAPRSSEPAAA